MLMALKKILITYDIGIETNVDQRRLRHVAKTCLIYGQRVQKSVFECSVTDVQLIELLESIKELIDNKRDSIRVYRLHASSFDNIIHFGKNKPINFEEPLLF